MKTALTTVVAVAVAASAFAILPLSPAEQQVAKIDRSAAAVLFYTEQAAQAMARLHADIFIADDEILKATLEKFGPEQSAVLLTWFQSTADGMNALLEPSGSAVRAPTQITRNWTWIDGEAVVEPLPDPEEDPDDE